MAFAGGAAPGAAAAAAAAAGPDGGGVPAALPPLLVSAAADRTLRLWNAATMQRQRALYKRPAEVTALAVSRCEAWARPALRGGPAWWCMLSRCCCPAAPGRAYNGFPFRFFFSVLFKKRKEQGSGLQLRPLAVAPLSR